MISGEDAQRLTLRDVDPIILHSDAGEFRGRILIAPVKPRTLQVHWPEGQVLIDRRRRSPQAGIPDYNPPGRLLRATPQLPDRQSRERESAAAPPPSSGALAFMQLRPARSHLPRYSP